MQEEHEERIMQQEIQRQFNQDVARDWQAIWRNAPKDFAIGFGIAVCVSNMHRYENLGVLGGIVSLFLFFSQFGFLHRFRVEPPIFIAGIGAGLITSNFINSFFKNTLAAPSSHGHSQRN